MSDYASIDASIDNAFSALENARGEISDAVEEGALPPNAISSEGIWALAKETKQKEKDAKALKAKQEGRDKDKDERRLGPHEIRGRKKADQEAGIDAALDKATKQSAEKQAKWKDDRDAEAKGEKPRPMDTKEFNDPEMVKHRRELKSRFPGTKLSARMEAFERWDEQFQKDPVGTREALMNEYLKYSPSNFAKAKPVKEGEGLERAVNRGLESAADREDLKIYEAKYGERLPHILRQLNETEIDLISDPIGASARLAANYGALTAPAAQTQAGAPQPAQSAQLPPPASLEESVRRGLDKAIEHNIFPGLQNDQIADTVATVLTLMPRTGDRFADLKTAYGMVVGMSKAVTSKQDDAGMKSIHGAPSAPSSGRRRGSGDSLDDAISRAFGR
jgi:hypothetical protein